ncbi:MAG: precorrin-2 C(20)-methyltransferase [Phormidesmis sp. RL_2_1]|nr:precorrin-2 C(20)-methyltransferase [Phormidesmis sp. RL_2_1]
MPIPITGSLYGIGVGPGDPELITLKALKRLQSSPVVAFPKGIQGKPGIAESIITPWLTDQQIRLPLTFPYVVDEQILSAAWQQAAEMVWAYLQTGDVVFACEGDVSFYGTFTYLAKSLQQQHSGVKIEVIAGVSSPMAAAAALGIPLTCQDQRLAILPALYSFNGIPASSTPASSIPASSTNELEAALGWADVIVLMKVSRVYRQVWKILAHYQLLDYSYVVANATQPHQVIYSNLQAHPDLKLPYFSLLIVGTKANDSSLNLKHHST